MNNQVLQVANKTESVPSIAGPSFDLIDRLIAGKKTQEARKHINDLLRRYPDDQKVQIRLARLLYFENRIAPSLGILDQLEQKNVTLSDQDERLLAVCCAQNKRQDEAERRFLSLLKRNPDDFATLENLFRFYLSLKRFDEMVSIFVKLIMKNKLTTNLIDDTRKMLREYGEQKRILIYDGIMMAFYPKIRASYFDAARVHLALKLAPSARLLAEDASRGSTVTLDGLDELMGVIAAQESNFTEAKDHLLKAHEAKPDSYPVMMNLAKALFRQRDYEQAASVLEPQAERYFATSKEYRDLYISVLGSANQSERAIEFALKIYEKNPRKTNNIDILAMAYLLSHRFEEGIAFIKKHLKQYGQPPSRLFHRYVSMLMQDCQHTQALKVIEDFLARNPSDLRAVMQAAFAALNVNEFEKGWKYYERRLEMKDKGKFFIRHEGPMWDANQDMSDKHLLLVAEQGLGDVLMTSRYIPLLSEKCKKLTFEVQSPLIRILKHNLANVTVVPRGRELPKFDAQIQMMSLMPRFNSMPSTMIGRKGYIAWDGDYDFEKPKKFTVAFAWQGEANHPNDINRSLPVECLEPLFRYREQVQFVSIQRGHHENQIDKFSWAEGTIKLGNKLNDFTDTAGLLKKIDLIICCDSAPIHLAGAMGRPAWCLVNTPCEWRWTQEGSKTYWYDSVRIFRVSKDDYSWSSCIERTAEALGKALQTRNRKRS